MSVSGMGPLFAYDSSATVHALPEIMEIPSKVEVQPEESYIEEVFQRVDLATRGVKSIPNPKFYELVEWLQCSDLFSYPLILALKKCVPYIHDEKVEMDFRTILIEGLSAMGMDTQPIQGCIRLMSVVDSVELLVTLCASTNGKQNVLEMSPAEKKAALVDFSRENIESYILEQEEKAKALPELLGLLKQVRLTLSQKDEGAFVQAFNDFAFAAIKHLSTEEFENPGLARHFEEMRRTLNGVHKAKKGSPFLYFYKMIALEKSYKSIVSEIAEGVNRSSDRGVIQRAYDFSAELIRDMQACEAFASKVSSAVLFGRLTVVFRDADDRLSKLAGRVLHAFCGCHILEGGWTEEEVQTIRVMQRDGMTAKEIARTLTDRTRDEIQARIDNTDQRKSVWPTLKQSMHALVPTPEGKVSAPELSGKSMLVASCQIGGGHDVMMRTFAHRASKRDMHVYMVDGLEELFSAGDPLKMIGALVNRDWSTTKLTKFLFAGNYLKTMAVLRTLFYAQSTPEQDEEMFSQAMEFILTRDPDVVMCAYSKNTGAIAEGGRRAAKVDLEAPFSRSKEGVLGVCGLATDFDPEGVDVQSMGPPKNPLFKHLVWDKSEAALEFLVCPKEQKSPLEQTLDSLPLGMVRSVRQIPTHQSIRKDQVEQIGLSPRPQISRSYSAEEIASIRSRRGIDPDAKVILMMSGGIGFYNQNARAIYDEWKKRGEKHPKIHVFVVCGTNKQEQKALVEYTRVAVPNASFEALGWCDQYDIGELFAVAGSRCASDNCEGLFITEKGGGGSISEAAGSGVRVLSKHPELQVFGAWEAFNIQHYCHTHGMGGTFGDQPEMLRELVSLLRTPKRGVPEFTSLDSEALSMERVSKFVMAREALKK